MQIINHDGEQHFCLFKDDKPLGKIAHKEKFDPLLIKVFIELSDHGKKKCNGINEKYLVCILPSRLFD